MVLAIRGLEEKFLVRESPTITSDSPSRPAETCVVRDNPMGFLEQEVPFVLCRLDKLPMALTEVGCKNGKLCLETAQKVSLIDRSY